LGPNVGAAQLLVCSTTPPVVAGQTQGGAIDDCDGGKEGDLCDFIFTGNSSQAQGTCELRHWPSCSPGQNNGNSCQPYVQADHVYCSTPEPGDTCYGAFEGDQCIAANGYDGNCLTVGGLETWACLDDNTGEILEIEPTDCAGPEFPYGSCSGGLGYCAWIDEGGCGLHCTPQVARPGEPTAVELLGVYGFESNGVLDTRDQIWRDINDPEKKEKNPTRSRSPNSSMSSSEEGAGEL